MKFSIKISTCLIGLALWLQLLSGLSAQPLDSLLSKARERNLNLKAMEQEYQSALAQAPQMRLLPATEIGLGGFPLPVQTRFGPQRMRLGIMQALPWFGTREAEERLSLASAEPLALQVKIEALDILYKIKLAYLHLYELTETQNLIRRNISLLESLRTLSLNKVEGGEGSTADVLRLDLKLRELRQQLLILDQQGMQPQIEINQLLDRPVQTKISPEDSLSFVMYFSPNDSLAKELHELHPAMGYLKLRQHQAQLSIDLIERKEKPRLGFGVDYIVVDDIPAADFAGNGRDILQLKASLSIPLQRKPYEAKKQEERLKIAAWEHRKEALRSQFSASIQKAMATYQEAKLTYELYQNQIENTEAVIQIMQADYTHNGKQFEELINLERDLLAYEIAVLGAIVESHKVKAEIQRIFHQ